MRNIARRELFTGSRGPEPPALRSAAAGEAGAPGGAQPVPGAAAGEAATDGTHPARGCPVARFRQINVLNTGREA